ncbi:bifunctional 4-hydroxy-2-oxoglutarate aldolase/2-dehydro-3-deoxy-phosphogluconate aldolase [Ferrovibrio sp.]|uniref:bifunctional 4-hydroxy-2-oxoglutarate aldolase/2-dehydro-3-deoxy-phosphogluconate aldolase n=1 Tax=Ferrovibrio sp. TaxID=1917215 RepID=UPI003514D9F4
MPDKTDRVAERAAALDRLIGRAPIVPVLAVDDPETAVPLARALVAAGVPALEIMLRTAAALEAIRRVATAVPEIAVGAGTVLNPAQFAAAQIHGAQFIVSPGATPALYAAAIDTGLPFLPGVVTPGEIMAALDHGFTRAKFFPAVTIGGPAALQMLAGAYPAMRFCPSGGLTAANIASFVREPNVFTAVADWVAPKEMLAAGDWAGITALTKAALQAAKGA